MYGQDNNKEKLERMLSKLKNYNDETSGGILSSVEIKALLSEILNFIKTKGNEKYNLEIIQELSRSRFGVVNNINLKETILQYLS